MSLPRGLAGFLAGQQQIQQQDAQELQQVQRAMSLKNMLEQRAAEQQQAQETQKGMAALAAEPVGDIPSRIQNLNKQALLFARNPAVVAQIHQRIAQLEKQAERAANPSGQPIGSGGLRLPDGTVIPPAARPETVKPAAAPEPTKPPTGYRWKGGKPDGELEPIPGGPAATKAAAAEDPKQSPENAGKIAMGRQAIEGIGTTRGIIFDKDGNLNRALVGAMNLPIVAGLPGNSQARIARSAMRNAVEAKLRIETGAAATEPEVERTLARFMPTVADTKESAKFKMDELEKFFKSSLSITKGAGQAPAAQKRLKFDAQGNPVD